MKRLYTTADRARLHRVAIRMLAHPAIQTGARRPRQFKMLERRAIMFRWRGFR